MTGTLDCLTKKDKEKELQYPQASYGMNILYSYGIKWANWPSVTNYEAIPHQLILAYFGLVLMQKVVQLPIAT